MSSISLVFDGSMSSSLEMTSKMTNSSDGSSVVSLAIDEYSNRRGTFESSINAAARVDSNWEAAAADAAAFVFCTGTPED